MDRKGIHGPWRMRGKARKTWSMLFIAAFLVAPLWGHEAFAALYDDFSSNSIQSSLWIKNDPNSFLSVVTGSSKGVSQPYVLHAAGSGSSAFPAARLTTTSTFSGDFRAGINFFNFSSTGYLPSPPGGADPINPNISLVIGNFGSTTDYQFVVSRILVNYNGVATDAIGYREVDSTGKVIVGGSVPYSGASGGLLLRYTGSQVYLDYSSSTNPNDWQSTLQFLASFPVTFSAPPRLAITTSPGGGGTLSGDVGGLYYAYNTAPVPLPSAVWLLGAGLVGLAGIKRKYLG